MKPCKLCGKTALYVVPGEELYFCADHRDKAVELCREQTKKLDRPAKQHWPAKAYSA